MRFARNKNDLRETAKEDIVPGPLGRILILSLTLGCLAMIAAVWWYYTVEKNETKAATLRGIFAVAAGKSDQLASWRSERVADGHVIMSAPVMRTARRVLLTRTVSDADRTDLLDLMRRLAAAFLYTDVTLVDLEGNPRLRLHQDQPDGSQFAEASLRELARRANQASDVILSDLTTQTRTRRPMMALTVPVQNYGAFILEIDPSRFLYPYLKMWPGSSRTAESLLVRREGESIVYLNRSRNDPRMPIFFRWRVAGGLPPDAVLDSGLSIEEPDRRGVNVIGTIRRIPDSPWLLSCKMDVAEVVAPLRRLGWEMLLITALIGLANAAGAGLIWKGQHDRIRREREAWYRAVANDTPAYLWMASAGKEGSFVNRPFQNFLGNQNQGLSKDWTQYLHPDDADRVRAVFFNSAAFFNSMPQPRGYTAEFRLRRADGEYRMVVGEVVPRFSEAGELLGFAGSILDITERRQAEEQLRTANAQLQTELAERIRREQEIQSLSARLIGVREDERKRLARELHDDLNQQIAAVSLGMGNLKRQIAQQPAEAMGQSDRIHHKLVQIAETVRRMSHELHPAMLELYGLVAALRSCCSELTALTGIRISFTPDGSFDGVPSSIALCVYRVTQEALQNVARHAQAHTAHVALSHADGILQLTVSDTGVGIDLARVKARTGLGLISIRERVRFVGGTVEINGQPNEGTQLTVRIPLE